MLQRTGIELGNLPLSSSELNLVYFSVRGDLQQILRYQKISDVDYLKAWSVRLLDKIRWHTRNWTTDQLLKTVADRRVEFCLD